MAFLVLFPIGGTIALLRHKIGPGWLKYHIFFQLLATFVVFAAAAIQVLKWKQKKNIEVKETKTLSPRLLTHVVIGSMVGILLILQLIWAFVARRYVPWNVWYYTHITMATLILTGGLANLYIGWRLAHG